MKYVKSVRLSPSEAREMLQLGFVLKLVKFFQDVDEYEVYVL